MNEFENKLHQFGVKFCYNEKEYDYSILEFIVVGDNPGDEEYKMKRFFIGTSGQKLRSHFHINHLTDNFEEKCIVFNKTFISTTKTRDLHDIKEKIGEDLFNNIQIHTAKEVANISNKFNIPILVFGKSNIGPSLLFDTFWKELNKTINNRQNILVFNHPSYDHFFIEWNRYNQQFGSLTPKELLSRIGTLNSCIINDKYIK